MKMNHCFFCGTYHWMIDKQEGQWIHKTYRKESNVGGNIKGTLQSTSERRIC